MSLAGDAFKKAIEVYNGLVKLEGVVDQIDRRITDFRDEARKRLDSFEDRLEKRANNIEARADQRVDALERRLLATETALAQLHGKTTAALAEAYKAVLMKQLEGGAVLTLTEGDGSPGGPKKE